MPGFACHPEELPQICTSDMSDEPRFIPGILVPQRICGFKIFQGTDGVRKLSSVTLLVNQIAYIQ